MKLDLSDDEKTKLIKDNVNAFLEQERARMEEYIENIQKQDIVSRDQKQQIEVLTETIRRIGVMITAPVIEASKTKVENIMKSDESDQDQEQNNTG
jgi:small-conductance mechanosensitive channel